MTQDRQLAAIMFTDIEGYTSLMQQDEEKAVNIRERHREVFDSITTKYKGKILQYYGDGTLSIFNSAIEAVECGIEMQLAFQQWPQIPVRIGIHLGDIIYSEEEIIGDGVNVASRVESLAVAGSVFLSSKVNDEIKNRASIQTKSMGNFEFKNVEQPMEVFAVTNEGLIVPAQDQIKGKTKEKFESTTTDSPGDGKRNQKKLLFSTIALIILIVTYLIYMQLDTSDSIPVLDRSVAVCPFSVQVNRIPPISRITMSAHCGDIRFHKSHISQSECRIFFYGQSMKPYRVFNINKGLSFIVLVSF